MNHGRRLLGVLITAALCAALAGCGSKTGSGPAAQRGESSPPAAPPGTLPPSPMPGTTPQTPAASGTVNVAGRAIVLPPPPGMGVVDLPTGSPPGGVVLARFVPDSTLARWQASGRAAGTHYLAMATAMGLMNRSDATADSTVEGMRSLPPRPIGPAEAEQVWNQALQYGLSGRTIPLPPVPRGPIRIARLDTPPDTFAEVLLENTGGRPGVAGTAIVVVRRRAIMLYVAVQDPRDTSELAAVQRVLLAWLEAMRAANLSV